MWIIIVPCSDGCGTWDADHDASYGWEDFRIAWAIAKRHGGYVVGPR